MYGPKWPFLLMYGSHNMRHTGCPRVDGLSTDPRDLGRHRATLDFSLNNNLKISRTYGEIKIVIDLIRFP